VIGHPALYKSVFFNAFSEGKPFAAIMIAHGTHMSFGGLLRPEGLKSRPHAERGFGGGCSELNPNQLGAWGSAEPRSQIHFGHTKSLQNASSGRKFTDH